MLEPTLKKRSLHQLPDWYPVRITDQKLPDNHQIYQLRANQTPANGGDGLSPSMKHLVVVKLGPTT